MTFSELFQLRIILAKLSDQSLPLSASYAIAIFMRNTDNDYNFYSERYKHIIDQYGQKQENGEVEITPNGVTLQPEFVQQANQELVELNNMVISSPALELHYNDLSKVELTPKELYALMPYIIKE